MAFFLQGIVWSKKKIKPEFDFEVTFRKGTALYYHKRALVIYNVFFSSYFFYLEKPNESKIQLTDGKSAI